MIRPFVLPPRYIREDRSSLPLWSFLGDLRVLRAIGKFLHIVIKVSDRQITSLPRKEGALGILSYFRGST